MCVTQMVWFQSRRATQKHRLANEDLVPFCVEFKCILQWWSFMWEKYDVRNHLRTLVFIQNKATFNTVHY